MRRSSTARRSSSRRRSRPPSASAIRPPGRARVAARDESGGAIESVTDDEILAAQRDIVRLEGIFCEPASAAGVAGVRRLAAEGRIGADEVVVCVLTGHGLKDPDAVAAEEGTLTPIPAELDAIRNAMGL